jgi:putative transcriptional regulator
MSRAERLLLRLGGFLILLMCALAPASAADAPGPVLLIATDRLEGSGYNETVLIAVPLRDGGHIGFILNRPTPVKLGTLYPEHAPSREVADPVYFGGPVLLESLFAVARRAPEGGGEVIPLMPGLVLAVDSAAVDGVIETMPNDARYFAGLTAWRPGELDDEIRAGAWEVRPADASTVFRADPGSLWRDLHTGPQGPGRRARAPLVGASLAPASWASAEMAAAAQDSIGN